MKHLIHSSDLDGFYDDFPKFTPGRITYGVLHKIIDWQESKGTNDVSHSKLDDYKEEGYSAIQASVMLGLLDYGQATGSKEY